MRILNHEVPRTQHPSVDRTQMEGRPREIRGHVVDCSFQLGFIATTHPRSPIATSPTPTSKHIASLTASSTAIAAATIDNTG